jgi:hypothetical protein
MRNNHGTAGEVIQAFFQRPQSIDINIVGWLIEEEHISFLFQRQSQMQTVLFSS